MARRLTKHLVGQAVVFAKKALAANYLREYSRAAQQLDMMERAPYGDRAWTEVPRGLTSEFQRLHGQFVTALRAGADNTSFPDSMFASSDFPPLLPFVRAQGSDRTNENPLDYAFQWNEGPTWYTVEPVGFVRPGRPIDEQHSIPWLDVGFGALRMQLYPPAYGNRPLAMQYSAGVASGQAYRAACRILRGYSALLAPFTWQVDFRNAHAHDLPTIQREFEGLMRSLHWTFTPNDSGDGYRIQPGPGC